MTSAKKSLDEAVVGRGASGTIWVSETIGGGSPGHASVVVSRCLGHFVVGLLSSQRRVRGLSDRRSDSCRSRSPSGPGADSRLSVDSALSALERNVLPEDSDEADFQSSLTTLNSQIQHSALCRPRGKVTVLPSSSTARRSA